MKGVFYHPNYVCKYIYTESISFIKTSKFWVLFTCKLGMMSLVICHIQEKWFLVFLNTTLNKVNCCLSVFIGQKSKVCRLFNYCLIRKYRAANVPITTFIMTWRASISGIYVKALQTWTHTMRIGYAQVVIKPMPDENKG
jgi:hypothetical protein